MYCRFFLIFGMSCLCDLGLNRALWASEAKSPNEQKIILEAPSTKIVLQQSNFVEKYLNNKTYVELSMTRISELNGVDSSLAPRFAIGYFLTDIDRLSLSLYGVTSYEPVDLIERDELGVSISHGDAVYVGIFSKSDLFKAFKLTTEVQLGYLKSSGSFKNFSGFMSESKLGDLGKLMIKNVTESYQIHF